MIIYDVARDLTFKKTPEGYYKGRAIVTKVGVYPYMDSNGETIYHLKSPDELLSKDSIESLKMIPVTLNHPPEMVNSDNIKDYAIGYTGSDPIIDGDKIILDFTITDPKGIEEIENGKVELSLGSDGDVLDINGTYNNQVYHKKQAKYRHNHLAVVDKARVGEDLRITIKDGYNLQIKGEKPMKKIIIDGKSYEVSENVEDAIKKERKQLKDANDILQGEVDGLKSKIESFDTKEQKQRIADSIRKEMKERIELEEKALKLKIIDEKEIDKYNNVELKRKMLTDGFKIEKAKNFNDGQLDGALAVMDFDNTVNISKSEGRKEKDSIMDAKDEDEKYIRNRWKESVEEE